MTIPTPYPEPKPSYRTTDFAGEKSRFLTALSYATAPTLVSRTLSYAMDPTVVRSQDATKLIAQISRNGGPVGLLLAWRTVRDRWTELLDRFAGQGSTSSGGDIAGIPGGLTSEADAREVREFFESSRKWAGAEAAEREAIDRIGLNAAWLRVFYDDLRDYLL
jgi:hypothetical protein